MIINKNKEALSFGCGSDGRLGHEESKDHRYLYREGKPRKI
jgi:regulator of chromosome condensation